MEPDIASILSMKRVAVVGMSRDPNKDAHIVPKYLLEHGYDVIPVNPSVDKILEKKCYRNLKEIPDDIDIVDIFRPSDQVMPIVKDAIEKNAKVIWMQVGIINEEAAKEAEKHGIKVVMNKCMMEEHKRLER